MSVFLAVLSNENEGIVRILDAFKMSKPLKERLDATQEAKGEIGHNGLVEKADFPLYQLLGQIRRGKSDPINTNTFGRKQHNVGNCQ